MRKLLLLILLPLLFLSLQGGAFVRNNFVIDAQNNVVLHHNLGLAYLGNGDYYNAIQEFKIAIALNPNTAAAATIYNNLGLTYIKIGRADWAETCFSRSVKLNPNFLPFYKNLALAYKLNKKLSWGLNKYNKIIELDADNSQAYLILGFLYLNLGNEDKALSHFQSFVRMEPDLIMTKDVMKIVKDLQS